jgi:salicylate hydroxylase
MFNTVAVFESAAFHRGETDWGGADELDDAFAGTCSDVRRGIRSLWRDRCWPMYDREPIDRWVDGRLALTGDAAHPMLQYLAQVACQAIEDAHVLSLEAAKSQIAGDTLMWQRILARYAAQRSDRTAQVQRTARFWVDFGTLQGSAEPCEMSSCAGVTSTTMSTSTGFTAPRSRSTPRDLRRVKHAAPRRTSWS